MAKHQVFYTPADVEFQVGLYRGTFCKATLYKWHNSGRLIPSASTRKGARLYSGKDLKRAITLAKKMRPSYR